MIVLGAFLVYQLREILPPIIFAFLLAYLLNPLVVFLQQRARWLLSREDELFVE